MKLSTGQRRLLNQLDNGAKLALWNGDARSAPYAALHHSDMSAPSPVNANTVYALNKRGYFLSIDSDWRRTIYTISPAGIAALGA